MHRSLAVYRQNVAPFRDFLVVAGSNVDVLVGRREAQAQRERVADKATGGVLATGVGLSGVGGTGEILVVEFNDALALAHVDAALGECERVLVE